MVEVAYGGSNVVLDTNMSAIREKDKTLRDVNIVDGKGWWMMMRKYAVAQREAELIPRVKRYHSMGYQLIMGILMYGVPGTLLCIGESQ